MRNYTPVLLSALILFVWPSSSAIGQSPPFTQAPPVGADTSAAILILITDTGISVKTDPSQGPFDGIEDTLIAVQNNSSQTVYSLPLSSPNPIFSFDGDGICAVDFFTGLPVYNPAPPGFPPAFGPTGYEGPGVSFSGINSTKTAGIVNFISGLGPGESTYFSLELAISTVCQPITGVPLLKQGCGQRPCVACSTAPWACTAYNNTAETIQALGCYLTSCAMLINYHAHGAFSTTPDLLNTWLNSEPGGYSSSGGVNPYAVAKYARNVGHISLYCQGRVDHADDFVVDNYLCGNDPVVLKVLSPATGHPHFVLATGQTVVAGTDTFLINDPGYQFTTLQGYNFIYSGIRKFSSTFSPPTALYITGHSPIDLLITDPSGHRTGFDPTTGQTFNEIPNSSYGTDSIGDDDDLTSGFTTPAEKVLDIPTPSSGNNTLRVFGTGNGPFHVDFIAYDSNGNASTQRVTGIAAPESRLDYKVMYSSLPGSQITVVPIDTTPPVISGMPVPGFTLWPLNHKLVTVAVISATDAESGVASFDVTATSNEPSDPSNPDFVIFGSGTGPRTVQLRADRLGDGTGRTYTITATAVDVVGNKSVLMGTCTVPHDQRK
jgi:hypothetical protein